LIILIVCAEIRDAEDKNVNEIEENIKGNGFEKEFITKLAKVKIGIEDFSKDKKEWKLSVREKRSLSEVVNEIRI